MKYFYNNQWNEIGIKALDSMPVGTVVEYTGQASDIPVGWEQVTGQNKIEKISQTSPTMTTIVDGYSASIYDGYSCNYVNNLHNGTLLWTNSDLTSDFAPQSIQIDLSSYNYFEIIFVHDKYSTTFYNIQKCFKGTNALINMNINTTAKLEGAERQVTISDTGVSFNDCYYYTASSGNTNTANLRNIPYKIIGYK